MSDLNETDDLLNYEIGELDDHELAGDEDELLLSDDESAATKEMLLPEAEEWIQSKLIENDTKIVNLNSSIESGSEASLKINLESSCFSGTDYTSQTSETETDTDITTSEIVPNSKLIVKSGDEVTSSETECVTSSPIVRTESVESSQQPLSSDRDDTLELDCGQIDGEEDCDEENERFNPKQSVERENNVRFQRPMRGMMSQRGNRMYGPRPGSQSFPPPHPYNKNENYNPHSFHAVPPQNQIMPQQPNMFPPNFRHPHPNNMRPPPQQQQPHHNMYRGPHPDFIQNQNMGGNRPPFRAFNPNMVRGSMPGQFDPMRPRMMVAGQQFHNQGPPQQRPPFIGGVGMNRMSVAPQMVHQIPQSSGMQQQPVVARKVLINPNFKGGVEAATNQLMMDTLNNKAQYGSSIEHHSHDDDELLRQQEEFINRNRQHIEKRRYERSPDRDREYSPPRRERRAYSRERDSGFRNSYRGGRRDDRNVPKRRRSGSFERPRNDGGKEKVEEDEETRAYRQQIEKQKAEREKLLREKEMRRKKAAGDKTDTGVVQDKKSIEESTTAQKLTPIVVKESKIISLKKKQTDEPQTVPQSNPIQRTIPTAKILPETKRVTGEATAVVKPSVLKKAISTDELLDYKDDDDDEEEVGEEFDEDQLLADSPSPPPQVNFPNRRVIIKSQKETKIQKVNKVIKKSDELLTSKPKGIFDRLERKVAVNESAKNKIKRIVISNE